MLHRVLSSLVVSLAAVLGLSFTLPALGQAYPSKPIRIVVPFPAGGPTDTIARAVGIKLTETWGQPVLVENRPGASTIIGAEIVAKAPADGDTLMFTADATLSVNPLLYSKLPYSPSDFQPISLAAYVAEFLMVNGDVPVNTIQELVAYSKANRGKLNYGSFGLGSNAHIEAEAFKQATGADMTHVPFKGAAEAGPALLNGQIHVLFTSPNQVLAHIRSGRIKALGVQSNTRSPSLPNVPTFTEAGVNGFDSKVWFGFIAPAKVPADIARKLAAEIGKIVTAPEFREKYITAVALEPAPPGIEPFAAVLVSDKEKYSRFVKAANVKLD